MSNVVRDRPTRAQALAAANLDPDRMPNHVAIIMDGNGRWAQAHGWERTKGHEQGAEVVRAITTESGHLGVRRLTLYAFSCENWSRPKREIDVLMRLMGRFLRAERDQLFENDIRVEAIGRLNQLPRAVQRDLAEVLEQTRHHQTMVLSLALSYGGRQELTDAMRSIAQRIATGELDPDAITERTIQEHLYAPGAGDVDLVIRTAGENRLSNFLPWQSTYAEYVSMPANWPEFTVADYHEALRAYQSRRRTFGRVARDQPC